MPGHWSAHGAAPETERLAARPSWVASPSDDPQPEAPGPASGGSEHETGRPALASRPRNGRAGARSFSDVTGSWPVEALGAGVAVCLALIKTLPALAVSLAEPGTFPRGAIVTLLLLAALAAGLLTGVLVVRVLERRRVGQQAPQTLLLVAGAAIFVTTYGLLVALIATLSDAGSALVLLF